MGTREPTETPELCSSDRKLIIFGEMLTVESSKYALNIVTVPNLCAALRICSATMYPGTLAGAEQFLAKESATLVQVTTKFIGSYLVVPEDTNSWLHVGVV